MIKIIISVALLINCQSDIFASEIETVKIDLADIEEYSTYIESKKTNSAMNEVVNLYKKNPAAFNKKFRNQLFSGYSGIELILEEGKLFRVFGSINDLYKMRCYSSQTIAENLEIDRFYKFEGKIKKIQVDYFNDFYRLPLEKNAVVFVEFSECKFYLVNNSELMNGNINFKMK